MSAAPFFDRLLHRRDLPAPVPVRIEVRPPQLWPRRESMWSMALRWLAGRDEGVAPARRTPLDKARAEFVAAMDGLADLDTSDLLCRAQHARSLRELWHLRSELYTLIARRVNEGEACHRLARVNQHFPTRAARSSTGVSVLPENSDASQRETV